MNPLLETKWHTLELVEIFRILESRERGLSSNEAEQKIKAHGLNKLPEGKMDSFLLIYLRQFQSPLIYILLIASVIVFLVGEMVDSFIILGILFFNALIGTIQEGRAQNTLLALKRFVATKATVLRDEKELIIPNEEIVIGDIIILQEGEKVPADARVITSNNLKIDEATLTGESEPKSKSETTLKKTDLATAEQQNMLFKGTNIVTGNGRAIVIATGLDTIIGKISKEISVIDTEIPLKASIRQLSRIIILIVIGISILLFALGIAEGESVKEMFITIIALSVSIIPEGLPIVMTLVLATGVWRMSKRNALIKNLQAVEALGQASIIAVDKTGTITKNEMVIQRVFVDGKFFEINGVGYEPQGDIRIENRVVDSVNHPELIFVGKIAALNANARVMFSEKEKIWHVSGDPTEAAMLVFAQKLGFHKDELEKELPLVKEISFDPKLRYHATIHQLESEKLLTIVGAPEVILDLSEKIWHRGKSYTLSNEEKHNLESIFFSLSENGLRVIALATKRDNSSITELEKVKNLTFVGFFGMKDALRNEVVKTVSVATTAGIKIVMITGDHMLTAQSIAKEAGIYKDKDIILTGQIIDTLSDAKLVAKLSQTSVFARVTPEHKLRIIKAYKSAGEIIAMTGDGVNDAPSLVAADLGVSMGKIGTEVAKEASDIVLLDDNFGSIISAIEEGRSILKTIKKVILYLFSTGLGEALTIIIALVLGFPIILFPAQIIWLNFVTDGFLDVSLAMEPMEKELMKNSQKRPKKYIFDKLMTQRMIIMATVMMVGTIILFSHYLENEPAKAWTVSLTVLAVFQWFNAWNCRHESKSIFSMNIFANKFLVGATFTIIALQLVVVYNSFMQKFLHTVPLNYSDWFVIISFALSIILAEEIRKLFTRKTWSKKTNLFSTPNTIS